MTESQIPENLEAKREDRREKEPKKIHSNRVKMTTPGNRNKTESKVSFNGTVTVFQTRKRNY